LSDAAIIALLESNSQEGLHELIKRYRGLVGSIVGRILIAYPLDIEECIADTFVSVWRHSKQISSCKGTLKGFVACISRNIAIDRYRKLVKERRVIPLEESEMQSDINIAEIVESKYDAVLIQYLIDDMTEPNREIFIRKFFLIQTNKEIVEYMGLDEKQVKNRIYQGKLRLKAMLKERGVSR